MILVLACTPYLVDFGDGVNSSTIALAGSDNSGQTDSYWREDTAREDTSGEPIETGVEPPDTTGTDPETETGHTDTGSQGDTSPRADTGGSGDTSGKGPRTDTSNTDTASDTGRTDSGSWTDTGPDTGPDTGGDTGNTGDTSKSDTSDTAEPDTGSGDTGEDCEGIVVSPAESSVSSTDRYEEIEVTLTGCATGVIVYDTYASVGSYSYYGTWIDAPSSVDGEETATLLFEGNVVAVDVIFSFVFYTDQGNESFTLYVIP